MTLAYNQSELELIAGTINITKTKKMLSCSFNRPPDITCVENFEKVKEEHNDLRKNFKNAVLLIGGDFNLPDMSYPHRVSQILLDLTQDLGLEQMVDFPTREGNTCDLIFTSHPDFKIRCKPLPPIGLKCDPDINMFDTSHKTYRPRPLRRKTFL